jgi:serine/threonine protein kinase
MSLSPGTRLGPYEVTGLLGSGGMGELYGARDTRLDRAVAIKLLLESFEGDPERLARFEREAKLLASLTTMSRATVDGEGRVHGRPPAPDSELESRSRGESSATPR